MKIKFISQNKENGSVYVAYEVENKRAINPKTKRTADEILIVGYPKDKIPDEIKNIIGENNENN